MKAILIGFGRCGFGLSLRRLRLWLFDIRFCPENPLETVGRAYVCLAEAAADLRAEKAKRA